MNLTGHIMQFKVGDLLITSDRVDFNQPSYGIIIRVSKLSIDIYWTHECGTFAKGISKVMVRELLKQPNWKHYAV